MPTDNNGAAAPVHPLELALLGLIAAALALRTLLAALLAALLALALAVAGWRPRADAPEPGPAVQTHQPRPSIFTTVVQTHQLRPSITTTVVALRAEARARGIRTAGGRLIAQARRADLLAALAG